VCPRVRLSHRTAPKLAKQTDPVLFCPARLTTLTGEYIRMRESPEIVGSRSRSKSIYRDQHSVVEFYGACHLIHPNGRFPVCFPRMTGETGFVVARKQTTNLGFESTWGIRPRDLERGGKLRAEHQMGFSRSLLQRSGKLKNLSALLRRNPPCAASEPAGYVEPNHLGHGCYLPIPFVHFLQHPFVYA
jgi:hypothetical protein